MSNVARAALIEQLEAWGTPQEVETLFSAILADVELPDKASYKPEEVGLIGRAILALAGDRVIEAELEGGRL